MQDIAIQIKNLNVSYKELSAYSIKRMLLKGGKKKDRELEAELLKYKEAAEKAEAAE